MRSPTILLLLGLLPVPLHGQVTGDTVPDAPAQRAVEIAELAGDGWNDPEALELVRRGREARTRVITDGTLESYQALTEGHIYFFIDPEEGDRSLIRVDQVAVELFWEAPDHVRQRLVGERSETRLPVRDFRYYLDRLTLVQYGFGDEIEVGQGMDVSGVPHPLAPLPGGDPDRERYDYRIGDSVSVHLPGDPEPLRVIEVQVRPRDPDAPGILGSIHLDRESADLIRMAFTFTPASYVDPRTDRIAVELDYGRWEGEYWLPYTQRIEVRREVPELDLGVGTVIRAVLRVGDYELNVPLPQEIRFAPAISTLPEEELRAFDFTGGLLSRIEEDGLADVATRADPRELRVEAAELLRNRPPTGLSPLRFHLPSASSALAYDRTRGMSVGGGLSLRPRGAAVARLTGGWDFGPQRPRSSLHLSGMAVRGWAVEVEGRWNGQHDLGVVPGMAGLLGTFGAAGLGEDYRDPYRVRALSLQVARPVPGGGEIRLGAGIEDHGSEALQRPTAPWNSDRAFRPVLSVREGTFAMGRVEWRDRGRDLPGNGRLRLATDLRLLAGDDAMGGRAALTTALRWSDPAGRREIESTTRAGSLFGEALPQHHRLLGGRGSVPGHPVHSMVGGRTLLHSLEGAIDLGSPLVRLRGGIHAGWADGDRPTEWIEAELIPDGGGTRAGITLGTGLLFDLLRIEGARGIGLGGEWQLLLSIDPRWWDYL